jgi:hypothetical protein
VMLPVRAAPAGTASTPSTMSGRRRTPLTVSSTVLVSEATPVRNSIESVVPDGTVTSWTVGAGAAGGTGAGAFAAAGAALAGRVAAAGAPGDAPVVGAGVVLAGAPTTAGVAGAAAAAGAPLSAGGGDAGEHPATASIVHSNRTRVIAPPSGPPRQRANPPQQRRVIGEETRGR